MSRFFYSTALILFFFIISCTHIKRTDIKSDYFEHKNIGRVKVVKPESWQYIKFKEQLKGIKPLKLRDKKAQKFMEKEENPLLVLMKYKPPYNDINPSIKVDMIPAGNMDVDSSQSEKLVRLNMNLLQKAFSNFKIVTHPQPAYVDGLKGSYARVQYEVEIQNKVNVTFLISSELWVIPKDEYFIMIGAATRADEKTGARKEIQDIIKTVEFI